jgi:eukaryotic-like serine/threonine-protein kinase
VADRAQGIGPTTQAAGELLAGRYRLRERIGSGGMASVHVAYDEVLHREVAVKRLHTGSPEDAAERLVREAKLGAALNHANLVTVYDALPDRDGVLIVMEYVAGHDLEDELDRGPLDRRHALDVLGAVAAALDHAHGQGIVHRDVKPSNILLGADGETKLADLGLARALEDTGITRTGLVIGSVPYMSPEQLTGEEVGPPSDIYSLALIAYEALSGRRARREGGAPVAAHQATREPPPDLREAGVDVPPAAADVVARALDRDPDRRPASAGGFVRDLDRALAAGATAPTAPAPAPPAPAPSASPPRRRALAIASVLGLAALGVVALLIALGRGGADEAPAPNGEVAEQPADGAEEPADGAEEPADGAEEPADGAEEEPAPADPGEPALPAATPRSPGGAVRTFYESAAGGDLSAAWRLATSDLRSQLGGRGGFESQFETLEEIEFTRLETTGEGEDSAEVAFATLATHTDRAERCTGSATLLARGGEWRVDRLRGVSCEAA